MDVPLTYPARPSRARGRRGARRDRAQVLWAADSIAFLATGLSDPTTAGTVWIVMQALVVAGFAALQAMTRGAPDRAVAA